MLKWDGHCHSELCPHGKGDKTADMVERAIELGFERLSLTEHAPLPEGLIEPKSLHDELALQPDQMEEYFDLVKGLQATYGHKIEILCGLEVDYISGMEDYTKGFLDQYGEQLDDALLSMHIIPCGDSNEMIDFSPASWSEKLLPFYGSSGKIQAAYWEYFTQMLGSDLGKYKPKRIGHAGLIYKFHLAFNAKFNLQEDPAQTAEIIRLLARGNYSLDYNVSGLTLESCKRLFIPPLLLEQAKKAKIPLVYGSDAHGILAMGQEYQNFAEAVSD